MHTQSMCMYTHTEKTHMHIHEYTRRMSNFSTPAVLILPVVSSTWKHTAVLDGSKDVGTVIHLLHLPQQTPFTLRETQYVTENHSRDSMNRMCKNPGL